MRSIILIVILFLWLSSCYKEVEISLEHSPKLTLNSLIKANAPIDVYLSESKLMYDTLVPLEQDAELVINTGQQSETLLKIEPGHYRSKNIIAQEGKIYSIRASADGLESVTAKDTLPQFGTFRITNFIPKAKIDEWGDVYSEVDIEIKDPAKEKNYYEIAAIRYNEYTYYDEDGNEIFITSQSFSGISSDDVYALNEGDKDYYPLTLLLSDELFDGKTINMKCYVYYNIGYITKWFFLLRNISPTYYKYKKKLIRHYENQYNDFWDGTGNPVQLFSNIENGYGIFAGYCVQRDTIVYADWE
jgi:hypothetical protein